MPYFRTGADGDDLGEFLPVSFQPFDGLGCLAEEVLVQAVLRNPVMEIHAGVHRIVHIIDAIGEIGAGECGRFIDQIMRFERRHAFGSYERTAVTREAFDDDRLKAEVDSLDGRCKSGASSADDCDVGRKRFFGFADGFEFPDLVLGVCGRFRCVGLCRCRFGCARRGFRRAACNRSAQTCGDYAGSDKETPTAQVRAYVLVLRRHDDLLSIPFPSNSLYIQSTCGIVPNQ